MSELAGVDGLALARRVMTRLPLRFYEGKDEEECVRMLASVLEAERGSQVTELAVTLRVKRDEARAQYRALREAAGEYLDETEEEEGHTDRCARAMAAGQPCNINWCGNDEHRRLAGALRDALVAAEASDQPVNRFSFNVAKMTQEELRLLHQETLNYLDLPPTPTPLAKRLREVTARVDEMDRYPDGENTEPGARNVAELLAIAAALARMEGR